MTNSLYNSTARGCGRVVLVLVALGLVPLGLGGCAATPTPNEAIRTAELAIAAAEQARVADASSPELRAAHDQLRSSRDALQAEKIPLAQRYAERSRLNAELASARFAQAKARAVNDEMQSSIDTLKTEMQRNTGARP